MKKNCLYIMLLFIGILSPISVHAASSLTEKQNVLIHTAEAYYNRKETIQYDKYKSTAGYVIPEQASIQNPLYLVCGAFVYDVYRYGFEVQNNFIVNNNLSVSGKTTKFVKDHLNDAAYKDYIVYTDFGGVGNINYTDLSDFLKTEAQIGDVFVYMDKIGVEGHTMLYIGNQTFIHVAGQNYLLGTYTDQIETGKYTAVRKNTVSEMETNSKYLFGKEISSVVVLRPMANPNLTPSDQALKRLSLGNLKIDKVSSIPPKVSLNLGNQITYSITIENNNTQISSLEIQDTIPQNTKLVSCTNCNKTGSSLRWNVSIAPNTKKTVSYTVEVTENGKEIISSHTTVSGIEINAIRHQSKRTFTLAQRKEFVSHIQKLYQNYNSGQRFDLNDLYKKFDSDFSWFDSNKNYFEEIKGIDQVKPLSVGTTSNVYSLLVDDFYGGRYFPSPHSIKTLDKYYPSRNVTFDNLVEGDILLVNFFVNQQANDPYQIGEVKNSDLINKLYIYIGNQQFASYYPDFKLLTTTESQNVLSRLLGEYQYMVLRPSYKAIAENVINPTPTEKPTPTPNDPTSEVITGVPNTNQNGFHILCGIGILFTFFGIGIFYKYQKQN